MNIIKPRTEEHRLSILTNLTTNIARRMGITIKPYDAAAVTDGSGTCHWTYVFDEHETRIYRTQNGIQRMADITLDPGLLIDLDQLETQIRSAIEKLILNHY